MKKIILNTILLGTLFSLSACSNNKISDISPKQNYQTYTIKTGSFNSVNKYIGNIEPFQQTILASKIGGKIINIFVNKGDYVKKGSILAKLDGLESSVSYQSAGKMKIALQEMKLNTGKMFDAQIKAMENRVNQSKSALNSAEITIKNNELSTAGKQIQQANLTYETALTELNNTKSILNEQEKTIYSNSKNSLSQANILLKNIGIFIDGLLGISTEKKHDNDSFEIYIGAKNSILKNDTKNLWLKLNNEYTEINSIINSISNLDISKNENKTIIYTTLQKTQIFLKKTRILLDNMNKILEDSMVSSSFSQTTLNNLKSKNLAYQNNLEKVLLTAEGSFLLGVKGSIQAIDNFNKGSSMKLDLLEKKVTLSKNNAEISKNNLGTKSNVAKQQYLESLANLEALKQQKASQLSQINSQITQLQGNQNMAGVQLNNTNITAPFDGIIMDKYVNLGQIVGPGTPMLSLGENKNVKVVVYIPENNLKNIKLGQNANIKIDSLNKTYSGTINKISPLVDVNSKKIQIEIKINNFNKNIKLGMYTNVSFQNKTLSGLQVPIDYIKYEYSESYIYKFDNGKSKKIYINILECNNNFCLIKNNNKININDKIIK